jgi:two-component system nitrogen regulation sensor histidine kinase GlnL
MHLNPAAEELFARSRERTVGLPARALPGGAPLAAVAERAVRAREAASLHVPGPQDPSVQVAVDAAPLWEGPECVGAVLTLRPPAGGEHVLDFEALAAGLAHEIKNPLAGLQGSAELLAREAEGGRAKEYALVIAREARRVDGLVRELLDLARPAALQPAPVNVHDVIGDVLVLARGLPGADRVRFAQRYDPSLPPVLGDEEKLTQVFLNLIRNAIDAVAAARAPEVAFETSVAALRVRAAGRTRPLARVQVLDNGPGIPEPMLARLFTPFATSKPHGTGLGLAISRRIVDAHGGRIEVRNRPAGGVEASVFLPLEVP